MASYYPDHPTEMQQQQMFAFIDALGEFYPCDECAGHLRKELRKHPPDVTSAAALSDWACRLHNLVNVRLGKPEFDCSKVFERWRDGPAGDEDACGTGH
jgi:FAD-linked sulfhydryl oxidase